jgi:mannose-6-phosphate isomerase-like protein (cupin superfamily)
VIHEDERRVLISHPYKGGEFKIVKAKQNCEVGNHYHKVKTEIFRLLSGRAIAIVNEKKVIFNKSEALTIKPGMVHTFHMEKDCILFCECSHTYDKKDDYEA